MSDTKPKAPAAKEAAPALEAAEGSFLASHPEYGDRAFTDITWANLVDRSGERGGWEVKPAKPTELA